MCYYIIQPFKTPSKTTSFFFSTFLAAHRLLLIASALILLPSASRTGKELKRNPSGKSHRKPQIPPEIPAQGA